MNKILVVVDMQNDFITGTLSNESAVNIIPNIEREIKSGDYSLIIFTRDTHNDDYLSTQEGKLLPVAHCVKNTNGWNVCDELFNATINSNIPFITIDKPTFGFNGWKDSYFLNSIDNIDEFVMTGTCTDICVVSNALAIKAAFPETKVTCLSDCCAPLFGSEEKQNAALEVMKSCQVNVI